MTSSASPWNPSTCAPSRRTTWSSTASTTGTTTRSATRCYRDDLSYVEKLTAYHSLADDYFETERYQDLCASRLPEFDETALAYFESPEFDEVLVTTVTTTFPPHEHEQFVAHFRGLLRLWCGDERTRLR